MQEPLIGISVNLAFVLLDTEQAFMSLLHHLQVRRCPTLRLWIVCLLLDASIQKFDLTLRSLSICFFETGTATGSELFSVLTWPHTTTFTLLSIFSPHC